MRRDSGGCFAKLNLRAFEVDGRLLESLSKHRIPGMGFDGLECQPSTLTLPQPPIRGLYYNYHDRISLRVQVPNNHIMLTPNLYSNYYYPNPEYLLIGYMDPLCLGGS